MAADYIEQIRTVQRHGPYHLLGWSFGGVVAQEIAVQLQTAGERVAALISMEGVPPLAPAQNSALDENPSRQNTPAVDVEPDENLSNRNAQTQDDDLLLEDLRRQYGGADDVISDQDFRNAIQVVRNNSKLMHSHEFHRFDGDLLLVTSASGRSSSFVDAWRPYISGDISEVALECDHIDMMRPEALANAWRGISRRLALTI
jgi:thioesterase domain-containing protein